MAVVNGNSSVEFLKQPFNSHIISSLTGSILDTNQTSSLNDRYVIGEQLGWGQFGVIRVCTDKSTGEVLACKSIAKDRLVTSDGARSVKLEIEIMTRLSGHPNVVDLKAVYEDVDYVHLVMELCAGGELFHQLEKHGRFCEAEAYVLFRHLMQVVLYCHEIGVVHRDLKPENILLATKASSSQIKLADFGLATYIKPGQSLHGTVGSPFYIAPEVLAGAYNQAADIWSAGVILYILLSGMPPFWGETKSRIFDAVRAADLQFPSDPWDRVTDSAQELVRGMLCTEPSKRLTARQVLDHSWMKNDGPCPEEHGQCGKQNLEGWGLGASSFSTLMTRNQDISFGNGSPIICDVQSPTFICRSSFSSFLPEPSTPFHGISSDSDALECSSPISSMPSFSFFSHGSLIVQRNCTLDFSNISSTDAICRETGTGQMFVLPEASQCCGHEAREMEHKPADVKKAGGKFWSRMLGIHSKGNHTIGLGECGQLDYIMTESVIRRASCTNLPTASSLRSPLVC
uniref:non-specific serine/threonine protein kinase n=1 Tax=Rhizophora mucronata TaxID=61149 RepID=A0A2P2L8V4_RHIMU